jgi:ATP synthase protein I
MSPSDNSEPEAPKPPPHQAAFSSLDAKLDAFEASRARKVKQHRQDAGHDGYRVLADLIGGILGGLGLGWLFDQLVHTSPWGLIGGMLVGTGLSVFMVVRTAGRMGNTASIAPGPDEPLPGLGDDDEDGPARGGPNRGD